MTQLTETIRPGAELDFIFDWNSPDGGGPWLQAGETITARTVTVGGALSLLSESEAAGRITAWLRCSDTAPVGMRGWAKASITTSLGRKDSRTLELTVSRGVV